ncbi:unnamed protein product [Polarella glacialis]|uniref:Uncharacterized protein n=1 Tax=Polarella glacialis TaxID=89957 RepID=A0A813FH81_POLGL|nr:unnamed protein product [Polarella glacialis]
MSSIRMWRQPAVYIKGRRLLTKEEPSEVWNDSALLDLKASSEDVFWSFAWHMKPAGATVQAKSLWDSYAAGDEAWERCSICRLVMRSLGFCGATLNAVPEPLRTLEHLSALTVFLNATDLLDVLMEGWGEAFSLALLACYQAATSLGMMLTPTLEDAAIVSAYTTSITLAANIGCPVEQWLARQQETHVDYERAAAHLAIGDGQLHEQLLSWSQAGKELGGWILQAGAAWLDSLSFLGSAWSHGGAGPMMAHPVIRGNQSSSLRRSRRGSWHHSLHKIARSVRAGWSLSVVSAAVAPARLPWLQDLELLVVLQRLADADQFASWAEVNKAFNTFVPQEASFATASLLWPNPALAEGAESGSSNSEPRQSRCRFFSQSGMYVGCLHREGPCGGGPEGSVSSLRVRCPVPWSAPWVGGGSVKLRLHLDLPSGGAQLRVTFRVKTSRPPPRTRVALCLQPRWDHAAVVGRWPNLLEDWLRFHLQVIQGIGRIYMYDVDGSLGGESPP